MHYSDGTPAKHGDIVRGTGYNISHEIIGTVIGLVPDVGACDIRVSTEITEMIKEGEDAVACYRTGCMLHRNSLEEPLFMTYPNIEYGECKAFTLVYRKE